VEYCILAARWLVLKKKEPQKERKEKERTFLRQGGGKNAPQHREHCGLEGERVKHAGFGVREELEELQHQPTR